MLKQTSLLHSNNGGVCYHEHARGWDLQHKSASKVGSWTSLRWRERRKSLNKNVWDQVLWARETEHPTQTLVFTKTAGRRPGWGHCYLRSSVRDWVGAVWICIVRLFSGVSRNGLLYRVQFIKTIALCPRWWYRKQTEQSVHDRLIFGVTNL